MNGSFSPLFRIGERVEKLAMSVLLSNLVARTPTLEDYSSIAELVAACDIAEHGIADSSTRELAARWQSDSFHLESDAWVIGTVRKQFVGFGCVWHREHEEFSTLRQPSLRWSRLGNNLKPSSP